MVPIINGRLPWQRLDGANHGKHVLHLVHHNFEQQIRIRFHMIGAAKHSDGMRELGFICFEGRID
jgi:hypothetical protein